MSAIRSRFFKWATVGAVAAGALFMAASANARDVSWSVGVNVPGVAIGVATPQPYYAPAPTYYAPAQSYYAPPPPVYYRPAPIYYAPPAPVYYGPPAPRYYGPGPGYYRNHGHHGHRDWR